MLTFKIAYTAFVLLVVAIWWRHYSWRNFLWFSDIGRILGEAFPAYRRKMPKGELPNAVSRLLVPFRRDEPADREYRRRSTYLRISSFLMRA